MEYATILLVLAAVFGLFMAWGIGANDVANAMATSVGSGALTVRQAIVIAAIFEFSGAFNLDTVTRCRRDCCRPGNVWATRDRNGW